MMNPQRTNPLYAGPRQGQSNIDGRNGNLGRSTGSLPEYTESNQSRAARFEDEKRRIIESCFSKRDNDGAQLESYITHVRVIEDALYPSSPPPPDSSSENKKNRVILVAVRKSGKVRVHKARENPNGTFSIGKTWNLDELSSIKTYSALTPYSQQEEREKRWASNEGFIVSLGKPYFWFTSTSKEKDFFIASLVKIYRKYTGGKTPELIGFSTTDLEHLSYSPQPNSQPFKSPNLSVGTGIDTPPPPYARSEVQSASRDGPQSVSPEPRRSPLRGDARPTTQEDRFNQTIPDRASRQAQSQAMHEFLQTRPPLPSISPKPSKSSFASSERFNPPGDGDQNGMQVAPLDASRRKLASAKSEDSVRHASGSENLSNSRPGTANTDRKTPDIVPNGRLPDEDMLPARRRPPIPKTGTGVNFGAWGGQNETPNEFVTPFSTPPITKVEKTTPTVATNDKSQNTRQISSREQDYFPNTKSDRQQAPEVPASTPLEPEKAKITTENKDSKDDLADIGKATSPQGSTEAIKSPEFPSPPPNEGEDFRPGLGPMVRKKKSGKEIANQFRKAALAATAFQPRQGGAGARLKALQEKSSNEPDGITGVVPAPLLRGMSTDSLASTNPTDSQPSLLEKERPATPVTNKAPLPKVQVQRSATQDSIQPDGLTSSSTDHKETEVRSASPDKAASRSPQRKRRQRQEAEVGKYCAALSIDVHVIEGRGIDFNELLNEFGWEGRLQDKQRIEDFEADVRREIGRAQATTWLGHVEQQESKVQDLSKAFDKAIAECEELDGLLTLYSHELDTLHDDIEFIEAQSQGLQVQTANQKLLQTELEGLLKTLTIPPEELRALRATKIDSAVGVREIEQSLAVLYRAMITIDPNIRQNKIRQAAGSTNDRTGVGVYADTEIGQMRAVRQKKEEYGEESLMFLRRFNSHMKDMFKIFEQNASDEALRGASSSSLSLSLRGFMTARQNLWMYNAMMLYVREVNNYEWQTLITNYEMNVKGAYQEQFRENTKEQRRAARKLTGDESEALFTNQEKDRNDDSITSTAARKLTVKRGKTVKTSALRAGLTEKRDGKPDAWETFDNILQQQAKVIAEEQNFVVHFFHLTSLTNVDFAELIYSRPPEQRKLPNLSSKQSYDPDRNMAKIVQQVIDGIYSFWASDMQTLVDWVLKNDQLQGVGVLFAVEQCLTTYEETNQEYITRTLRTLHERLTGLFHKFVDEQVKAIEETKVKVKKRKGVISFMRTFPIFSAVVESMMPQESSHHETIEVRFIVNDAYTKILRAMWESLNFIAKDNPAAGGGVHSNAPTSGDPEDKEALNYHILLIENMNYYLEEVETQHNVILDDWAERASQDLTTHMSHYLDAVIRRPLGKWLDFVESTEALMKGADSYNNIVNKPSHSRSSLKRVLTNYDSKEIRKGIETLKKRIEKHFGDMDDPSNISRSLISRVFEESRLRYIHAYERMETIINQVYDGNMEIEWRPEEVTAMFKR